MRTVAIGMALLLLYAVLALALARFVGDKWHPDGGRQSIGVEEVYRI